MLAGVISGCGQESALRDRTGPDAQAASIIKAAGGQITRENDLPDHPVTSINLMNGRITDAVLRNLKEFKNLKTLFLCYTGVTDVNLKELADLKMLETLGLEGTRITDAGLVNLKEVKSLKEIYIHGTKVTDAGVKEFQRARPGIEINR
jgi:hypothetical protein